LGYQQQKEVNMLARPELDQTSLKLLGAADLLKRDGWCTFTRHHPMGQRCLLGALDDVGATDEAIKRLAAVLPLTEGVRYYEKSEHWLGLMPASWKVANWNNYACKSAEEAADKLREAAYQTT
jgi:hypothetical protein